MNNHTNKPDQLFAKLGHGFANDPKIITLSDGAFRAYIEALLFSCANMTDGFIDRRIAERMGWAQYAQELTTNDVEPSWILVDGGWQIHAFCEWQMTREQREEIRSKRSKAGIASGKSRQTNKTRTRVEQDVEQNANKNELEIEVEVEIEREIDKTLSALSAYSDDFESWWKIYPRRVAKGAAYKAFQKALKRVSFLELIEKTTAYANGSLPQPEFIPHPATWLNDDRWADAGEPLPTYWHHHPSEDWMYPPEQMARIREKEAEMRARGELA